MENRLDLVVFGATGFTGKQAVLQLVSLWKTQRGGERAWGVAGRSQDKLKRLIEDVQNKTGEDLKDVKIIIATVEEEASLQAMTAQAKVLVNCCGPYRFFGEPVVKACIATKTHHVDVTGEPQFMETMQLKYHNAAKQAGVYIVSACGFDSIPNDLGVIFLQKNFKGTVNSIESYLQSKAPPANGGAVIHYGTWESLIHGVTHMDELPNIRKELYPTKLPQMLPKLQKRGALFKGYNNKDWCVPFPGSDNSVVYRTQRFLHEHSGKRPAQFQAYFNIKSFLAAIFLLMGATIVFLLSKFSFTRSLMLDYPKIFSLGMVSHEGPSEEQMNNTVFWFYLIGQGWDESVKDITKVPPKKEVRVKVTGVNPGYGATVVALLLSAFTILKEPQNLPPQGGVYTPGAAFGNTGLIESLHANNLKFEVVES